MNGNSAVVIGKKIYVELKYNSYGWYSDDANTNDDYNSDESLPIKMGLEPEDYLIISDEAYYDTKEMAVLRKDHIDGVDEEKMYKDAVETLKRKLINTVKGSEFKCIDCVPGEDLYGDIADADLDDSNFNINGDVMYGVFEEIDVLEEFF